MVMASVVASMQILCPLSQPFIFLGHPEEVHTRISIVKGANPRASLCGALAPKSSIAEVIHSCSLL
ncbi:hypothetical protein XH98_13630 [Bradyrhizobium sp. CCBAU 51745]|nr:hypothetical protein [Bradyrhizobium sp. CCBAU 51745]